MKRRNIYNNDNNKEYEDLHHSDSEVNSNLAHRQSDFAKNDVDGRLARDRSNTNQNNNNEENQNSAYQGNSNRPFYITYANRKNYPSKDFYGDVTKPWSVDNTAGWSSDDMTNPYNPNANQNSKKKMSTGKKVLIGICAVIALIAVWCGGTDYEANHQSAKPQHPEVIRKTIINKQAPQKSNNSNQKSQQQPQNQGNKVLTPQDKQAVNKLTGEMQRLKLTNQEQSDLINAYSKLDNNLKPEAYKWASRAGNMALIPNGVKRFAVVHILNHYNNQNPQNNNQ